MINMLQEIPSQCKINIEFLSKVREQGNLGRISLIEILRWRIALILLLLSITCNVTSNLLKFICSTY